MRIYPRETYLKRIRGFYHDAGLIKVLTGVRRCGKSCLILSIQEELIKQGISPAQIITLNLDSKEYQKVTDPDTLEKTLDALIAEAKQKENHDFFYLFIDEIQNVPGYEKLINAYREEGCYSIFVTGSNSYLLSGELMTKLTGRYIDFDVYPLTFDEYLGMKKSLGKPVSGDLTLEFDHYLREGGFPKMLEYDNDVDKRSYMESIVSEILEKDIKSRVKIKNQSVFYSVMRYLFNNFGATTNLTHILSDLHHEGMDIKRETLNRYIQILLDAKVLHRCERFDMKSRRSLRGEEKYYLSDLSFFYVGNTDNRIQYGPVLENVVYLYSKAKGYQISVGKWGSFKFDFIVRKGNFSYAYLQVALTIADRDTEEREYRPLEKLHDGYPKYVLTRSDLIQERNGIHHVNLPYFMGEGKEFV